MSKIILANFLREDDILKNFLIVGIYNSYQGLLSSGRFLECQSWGSYITEHVVYHIILERTDYEPEKTFDNLQEILNPITFKMTSNYPSHLYRYFKILDDNKLEWYLSTTSLTFSEVHFRYRIINDKTKDLMVEGDL